MAGLNACDDSTSAKPVGGIAIEPRESSLEVGDTVIVLARVLSPEGRALSGYELTWNSSDPTVATVTPGPTDRRAIVEALEPGDVRITAATEGKSATASIEVINQVPVVSIDRPTDAAIFLQGDTVRFQGSATDPEDGTLSGGVLVWTSDIDGVIGTGESFETAELSAGAHEITLEATDAHGASGSDTSSVPIRASFESLSSGWHHVCGPAIDAANYCWGWNATGQLGDGTTEFARRTPVPVSGGLSFSSLSAGRYHTCGMTTGGATYCWGHNTHGQLGDGTTIDRLTPVPVTGGPGFESLVAGEDHTCGRASDGTAYCWGYNVAGQLGDETTTDRLIPTPVSGGLTFVGLTAGNQHTCGVTSDGSAYCWGDDGYGQLGTGDAISDQTSPAPVSGGLIFTSVDAGELHTCGVTTDGEGYCWGANHYGQLGDGTQTGSGSPMPVSGALSFRSLSAGRHHTCGMTTGGSTYCWGRNTDGQLGDGTKIDRLTPVPVTGGPGFESLVAGRYHTCGRASDGTAYCWGYNVAGQLGDGGLHDRTQPWPVSPPERLPG